MLVWDFRNDEAGLLVLCESLFASTCEWTNSGLELSKVYADASAASFLSLWYQNCSDSFVTFCSSCLPNVSLSAALCKKKS